MKFSMRPFRRLQWQLSLSYTLVAVGGLVVVEFLLLVALIIALNSDVLPNLLVRAFREQFSVNLRPYLDQPVPDVQGLAAFMGAYTTSTESAAAAPSPAPQGNYQIWRAEESTQNMIVVDAQGRLLWAQYLALELAADYLPTDQRPELLALPGNFPPGLARVLPAALAGEAAPSRLYEKHGDLLVMAVPVESKPDDSGARRVLGAMVMVLQMPSFTNPEFMGQLLPAILGSLLLFTLAAGLVGSLFGAFSARRLTGRLAAITTAADGWSRGDFSTFIRTVKSDDELDDLSRRLNMMAEQLQALLATRQELAALRERNRIARELHDSVKQQVFASAMQLGAARALIDADDSPAGQRLVEAERLTRQAQAELTALIHELRPAALEGKGLLNALRELSSDWSRQTGIAAAFECPANFDPDRLDLPRQQALFRVVQEALANIARHSQARSVRITLHGAASHGERLARLAIADDGHGFDPHAASAGEGFGLHSMRERVEAAGGQLAIESAPGAGAKLTINLPY